MATQLNDGDTVHEPTHILYKSKRGKYKTLKGSIMFDQLKTIVQNNKEVLGKRALVIVGTGIGAIIASSVLTQPKREEVTYEEETVTEVVVEPAA